MKKIFLTGLFLLSAIATVRADETMTKMPGDKPGVVWSNDISAKATVTAIKTETREITLKGEDGNEVVVVAGDEVKNFPQIKKGDIVVVEYLESVALFVRAPEDAPAVGAAAVVAVAAPGQKPGVHMAQTEEVTATVLKVNQKTRELVLQTQDGAKHTVKIGPEVKRFDQIKKGDHVVSRITTAVAISVQKP